MDATPSREPLLPTLIETHLARCAVEGKSPRTIAAYRESLTRFLQLCAALDLPLLALVHPPGMMVGIDTG